MNLRTKSKFHKDRGISLTLFCTIFALTGYSVWAVVPALAQCGDELPKSSCITCHEQQYPVYEKGEWHCVHARKDCCANCHGGNCIVMDKELAHEDLVVHPLEDIYTNCYSCHPDDYQSKAEKLGVLLGVTPMSYPTATPASIDQVELHTIVIPQASISVTPSNPPLSVILVGATSIGFFLLILWIFYRRLKVQTSQ